MDPKQDGMFPQVPENAADLTDIELGDLIAEHRDVIARIKAKDVEFTGERTGAEIIAELEAGVEAKLALDALVTERAEEMATFEADVDALAEKAGVVEVVAEGDDDSEGEGDGEGDGEGEGSGDAEDAPAEDAPVAEAVEVTPVEEGEPVEADVAVPVEEPVLADAAPKKARSYPNRPPSAPAERRPRATEDGTLAPPVLVAAGGNRAPRPGEELDRIGFAKALIEVARHRGTPRRHRDGGEERILVASADIPYPEERRLREGDLAGNTKKIAAIGNPFLGARVAGGADGVRWHLCPVHAVLRAGNFATGGGRCGRRCRCSGRHAAA